VGRNRCCKSREGIIFFSTIEKGTKIVNWVQVFLVHHTTVSTVKRANIKSADTHWKGIWVDTRNGLDPARKGNISLLLLGI
jgi:hypothetical protein